MAADINNRYRTITRYINDDPNSEEFGITFLGTRDPIRYVDDVENAAHVVRAGDTLESLAARFFQGFADPASLAYVIAEFQPTPIFDLTRKLPVGRVLVIPSSSLVHTLINQNATADRIV